MASTTAVTRGNQLERPRAVTWAVSLTVVSALATFPAFLLPGSDEVPGAVIVISIVFAIALLVGAWGLWQLRRWGAIATFVLTALNAIATVPAFFERPSGWIVATAALFMPIAIAVLVLLLTPSARRSYR